MSRVINSGRGSAADLLAFQREAWSGLVLSVTRRCPLTCSHCITRSGPDPTEPLLAPQQAQAWAAQLPELRTHGLKHITFTGGEPLLAARAVEVLSEAAASEHLDNYIVTSAAWATSAETAVRIVEKLRHITQWDIGYDEFHADQMPLARLVFAIKALESANARYTVRVCLNGEAASESLDMLADLVGPHGQIMTQPTRALGRAGDVMVPVMRRRLPRRPCVSTGLFVRADGSTGPCCSGLAYEAQNLHPFQYGNAHEYNGLLRAWLGWHDDQLLRVLRLIGFPAIEAWIAEELEQLPAFSSSDDPCEACVGLWTQLPQIGRILAARAATPVVSQKLDAVEEALYGYVQSTGCR